MSRLHAPSAALVPAHPATDGVRYAPGVRRAFPSLVLLLGLPLGLLVGAAPRMAEAQPAPGPPPLPPPSVAQPSPLPPPPPPVGVGAQPAQPVSPPLAEEPPPVTPLPSAAPPPSVYGAYTGPSGAYVMPPVPPPPPRKDPPSCCFMALRYDPFELLYGRLTFQAEIAVAGPVTVELEPSWIWGTLEEATDEKGFALGGNVGVYFGRTPLRGWWVKGHVAFETFEASVTSPDGQVTVSERITSPILGAMIGSSSIWGPDRGRDGGFILTTGVGIGAALADRVELVAVDVDGDSGNRTEYYDGIGRLRLLGTVSVGAAF